MRLENIAAEVKLEVGVSDKMVKIGHRCGESLSSSYVLPLGFQHTFMLINTYLTE